MKLLSRISLNVRLNGIIILCVSLTMILGIIAVSSLNAVKNVFQITSEEVGDMLGIQKQSIITTADLRTLTDSIRYAETPENLQALESSLPSPDENSSETFRTCAGTIRNLFIARTNYLSLANEREKLLEEIEGNINSLAKVTMELADNIEFDTILNIEDSLAAISEVNANDKDKTKKTEQASKTVSDAISKTKSAFGIRLHITTISPILLKTLQTSDSDKVGLYKRLIKTAVDNTKLELKILGDQAEGISETIEKTANLAEKYFTVHDNTIASSAKLNELQQNVATVLQNQGKAVVETAGATINSSAQKAEQTANYVEGRRFFLLFFCLFVACIVVPTGISVSRSIGKPLRTVINNLKDVAQGEGDLTQRITINDTHELGELAKWFNVFIERIQDLIKQIISSTTVLTNSSTNLSEVSHAMSESTASLDKEAGKAAGEGDNLARNIDAILNNTEEVSSSINDVAAAIEQMSSGLSTTAAESDSGLEIVKRAEKELINTKQCVSRLSEAGNRIGDFIGVIGDIADMTNLLALNATIEAASAGEAGKGFAVVAGEVKSLARQSAEAAEQIAEKVKQIIDTSQKTTASMGTFSEIIQQVNQMSSSIAHSVREQSSTVGEISGNVSQADNSTNSITKEIEQAAQSGKNVSASFRKVSDFAGRSNENAGSVRKSYFELAEASESLKNLVSQFKV